MQLEQLGLKLDKATGAVIDATIIASSARPRRMSTIEHDRHESGAEVDVDIRESADRDARWLKKGERSYVGYIRGLPSVIPRRGIFRVSG